LISSGDTMRYLPQIFKLFRLYHFTEGRSIFMKKYMSFEEFIADYNKTPEWFNMLCDTQSIQEFSSLYKLVVNMVLLSTDLEDNDIYIQKKAINPNTDKPYDHTRYSIAKKGLLKIMSAADARLILSNVEIDRDAQTVSGTSTMQYHDPSGQWRYITKTKTVDLIKKTKNGSTYEDPSAPEKAESGAQMRCIRDAFNIKNNYSLEQLQKPFVVVYPKLNDMDPDVKKMAIINSLAPTQLLYGRAPSDRLLLDGADIDGKDGGQK
ncbi:MAG: hypothetical protein M0R74_14110, partial [Dehalococcoidia bacterium]|nr:hypothetical protein [Dehalococcoidia bacterium]